MARKIRLCGYSVSVVILIAGLIAICLAVGQRVGNVNSATITESTAHSVSLKWSKVGSADGYYIYQRNGEKYKKIATVKGKKNNIYEVKKLADATRYDFSVKAYKQTKQDVVSSKKYLDVATAFTLPQKQDLSATSYEAGTLSFSVTPNDKASGYEIQYAKSKDFSDAQIIHIKQSADTSKVVENLNIGDEYFARARAFVFFNDKKICGDWSEVQTAKVPSLEELTKIQADKPMIAVTFDDGPGYNGASDKILDVIEKYHIKATFFMVGNNAADHPKNVQRKVALGCEIGNHTVAHAHYGKNVIPSDISRATEKIEKAAGGAKVTCFRSTGGQTTKSIREECKKEGLPLYYWSLDTEDWKSRNADKVYKKVMNNVSNGDIILMHEIYDSTAEAFEKMVPELLEKGYQFVTCEELVKAQTGKAPEAGTQYVNGKTIRNETH